MNHNLGYYAANEKERTRIGNFSIVTNESTKYITQLDLYNKNISYQVDWLVSNLCSVYHSNMSRDETFTGGNCTKHTLGQFSSFWDWVKDATYTGRYNFLNVDTWSVKVSYIYIYIYNYLCTMQLQSIYSYNACVVWISVMIVYMHVCMYDYVFMLLISEL